MHYFSELFKSHSEMALYLTLALGFWAGNIKLFGKFSLGTVTSTLIAGLVIGQSGVALPPVAEAIFFDMFLFAVGYSVGPLFIRALRGEGLSQVVFTLAVCLSGFGAAWALSVLMGYNAPVAAGLLAGGYTNSSVVGAASGMLNASHTAVSLLPVAYAVTYPFGTAGTAWFLSVVAPRLLRIDLPQACHDYEIRHAGVNGSHDEQPEYDTRSFMLNDTLAGVTVEDAEKKFGGALFIRQIFSPDGGQLKACEADTELKKGERVTLEGSKDAFVRFRDLIGCEYFDAKLCTYRSGVRDIILKNHVFTGTSSGTLLRQALNKPAHGIFMTHLFRHGNSLKLTGELKLNPGDIIRVRGEINDLHRLASSLGTVQGKSERPDMAFMCSGIFIGCLAGTLTLHWHGVPLSIGTSVGTIVAGILFGCLHESRQTFGQLPGTAQWIFSNLGLNGFIAVVGINAAPGFISGITHYGLSLLLCGAVVTLVPLFTGLILGRYVFRFDPEILLGLCAGARSCTASLGAVQEVAKSQVPVIGYTTGYAVSRLVMSVFAIVMVSLFH